MSKTVPEVKHTNEVNKIVLCYIVPEWFGKNHKKGDVEFVDIEIPDVIKKFILNLKTSLLQEGLNKGHIIGFDYRLLLKHQSDAEPEGHSIENIFENGRKLGLTVEEIEKRMEKDTCRSEALRQNLNRKIFNIFGCDIYFTNHCAVAFGG